MIAWWTGGAWVNYFTDAPTLVHDLAIFQAPVVSYVWIGILTFTTYVLAGFMREQVCLFMCPWPRIQAALTDEICPERDVSSMIGANRGRRSRNRRPYGQKANTRRLHRLWSMHCRLSDGR